jgi:hypothetical protein
MFIIDIELFASLLVAPNIGALRRPPCTLRSSLLLMLNGSDAVTGGFCLIYCVNTSKWPCITLNFYGQVISFFSPSKCRVVLDVVKNIVGTLLLNSTPTN